MKKLFQIIGLVSTFLLCAGIPFGCAKLPVNATPEQTAAFNAQRAQQIQDTAVVLRTVSRSAAVLAIDEDVNNAKYVQLAVTTLDTFVTGTNYTPGALVDAMQPVLKQLSDAKIKIAVNSVLDLYEIFYGRLLKNKINASADASLLIGAIRDGAAQALPTKTTENRGRENANYIGTYLGMVAQYDGAGGVDLYSENSGQLLRAISLAQFVDTYILKTRAE